MNINSASATLGMTLLAVGLLIAVPGANAATTVSTADQGFILAAAQGGMTEVKLGELAGPKKERGEGTRARRRSARSEGKGGGRRPKRGPGGDDRASGKMMEKHQPPIKNG